MEESAVYPNAPVALVALELRHPAAQSPTSSEIAAIKKRLSDRVPIVRNVRLGSIQMVAGAPGATTEVENYTRFINRTSTLAVSIQRQALVIEASDYPGWEEFKSVAIQALEARMAIAPVDGVERLGIRYINEIRVPGNDEPDWSCWLSRSLLGPDPTPAIDLPLSQWQGVGAYGTQPGHMIVMRYGPRVGFAVDPGSELKRARRTEGGPYFLMDIDSFWTPEDSIPEINTDSVAEICERLHEPVHSLFEGLVSEQLRKEVFFRNDR